MLQLTPRAVAAPNRPKYLQLSDAIRDLIADGYLRPGENLPSESAIAAMVGLSAGTVRQALADLETEGRIQKRNGVPTRVTPEADVRVLSPNRYFEEDARIRADQAPDGSAFTVGHGIEWDKYTVDIEIRREVATPKDLVLLQLPAGSRRKMTNVWRRYFLKYVDGVPVEIQRSALPEWVVKGNQWLIQPGRQPAPGGTQRELAQAGYRSTTITERHKPRMPSENEQRDLRIGKVPVLETERIFWWHDPEMDVLRPVEASRLVLPGDRHEIAYTTELPSID